MYLTGLPVELAGSIAVICILIRKHLHILADSAGTLVLETYGTAGGTGSVIVKCILQCKILEVGVLACNKNGSGSADTLILYEGSIADNGLFHALTNQ